MPGRRWGSWTQKINIKQAVPLPKAIATERRVPHTTPSWIESNREFTINRRSATPTLNFNLFERTPLPDSLPALPFLSQALEKIDVVRWPQFGMAVSQACPERVLQENPFHVYEISRPLWRRSLHSIRWDLVDCYKYRVKICVFVCFLKLSAYWHRHGQKKGAKTFQWTYLSSFRSQCHAWTLICKLKLSWKHVQCTQDSKPGSQVVSV